MERRSAHNNISLNPLPQLHVQLSSDFDSGNLQSANVLSISYSQQEESEPKMPILKLELIPSGQPFNTQYSARQSNKNFFHFNIKSNKHIIIHAHIRRMNILSIIESSFQDCYRVAVGHKAAYGSIRYHKADLQSLNLNRIGDEYTLEFQYQLPAQEKFYFAYHFPYSYQKMCHYLQDLDEHFKHSQTHNENSSLLGGIQGISINQHNNIYFKNELLTQSLEGRQINLLTITELSPALKKSGLINLPRQPRISKSLFPYFDIVERPFKFNKPYILVTSRVHPGQTSASFALEGFVNRLLGSSPEAEFIRKSFVILIVPMINPDGVFHGTYRMDMLGHNLNRFYNSCAAHKQPAIFAISTLLQHHSQQLVAFFDIHSHPQAKGSFAYGNAFTSIQDQTQSQVFAKLLSLNSESFSYQACTFSQKNMNSKDINDILSKDGSARVCAYKKMMNSSLGNGVHCFALELGYHGCPVKKEVNRTEEIYEFKSAYKREVKQFDINDYMEFGTDLVNTICQVYVQTFRTFTNGQAAVQIQSTNQAQQVQPTYLQIMRQETAKQIFDKEERFRILDSGLLKKIKNIQNLIFNSFYSKIVKKYPAILEIVKDFDTHNKSKKQVPKNSKIPKQGQKNIKIVHSLELGKNNFYGSENKRVPYNNQLEEDFKKLKDKLPPRDLNIKNLILRANAQKVSVIPMEFHIPTSSRNASEHRNFRRRDINYNRILEMQADSLPRIQKKKFNLLTERLRLKQKRVQSSINTHNFQSPLEHNILPISRGGLERKMYRGVTHNDKGTIDSNIDDIIEYENIINVDPQEVNEEEYQRHFQQATEEYSSNFNPEFAFQMNVVRNQIMFPRQSQLRAKHKVEINPMTERIHHRRLETNEERKRSKSRQKLVISNQNQNMNLGLNVKALPKLPLKMEKMKNKFDLELKMKQKYDRQYKLDDKIKGEGK